MSDALTNAAAAALNAGRKVRRITGELTLLNHAPGDSDDYLNIATVRAGWLLATSREGMELKIVESADATPELLGKMVAVAYGGKVFKIDGTDKKRPLGAPLLWVWPMKATGETFP